MGEWWRQLFAESEGKDLKGIFTVTVGVDMIRLKMQKEWAVGHMPGDISKRQWMFRLTKMIIQPLPGKVF